MSKISSGEPYSIAEVWEYISVYVSVCLHTHTHTPVGSASVKNPNTLTHPLHRVVVQVNINIGYEQVIKL